MDIFKDMSECKSFTITENKGFRLNFANGWAISVQWGKGNYCQRRSHEPLAWKQETDVAVTSADAEVAVFTPAGTFYRWDENMTDDVQGHMNAEQVAALITKVANGFQDDAYTQAKDLLERWNEDDPFGES